MGSLAWWRWVFVVAIILAAGDLRADCREAGAALRLALQAQDLPGVRTKYEVVRVQTACSDAFRERAGRAVSSLHAHIAQRRMDSGATLASQRELLEQALDYGRSWPVVALLGDEASARRDHDRAARLYQEALVLIEDDVKTPVPPRTAEIERIFRRAARSRMLATQHHPVPQTRSGAPGGLGAERIRGFAVKQVPMPIGFHSGTDRFTERGLQSVAELASMLQGQRPHRITLVGHTDPRGSEQYNQALSERRVKAVGRYLREQGFAGDIEMLAKGESERFPLADPTAWTEEERWRMDRRVELIR